jgi:DNA-binding CsgD family transcriptional regulator
VAEAKTLIARRVPLEGGHHCSATVRHKRRHGVGATDGCSMTERTVAGGVTHPVLEMAADLSDLREASAVADRFQIFAGQLGFSSVACFKVPDPGEALDQCVYMSTRPKDWMEHYTARDYVRFDPLIQHLSNATQPFRWSEIFGRPSKEPIARKIQQERFAFGLRDGVVVPIHGARGYSAAVSFACESDWSQNNQTVLVTASIVAHNRLLTLLREKQRSIDPLTARERECLKWAAEGKSDWEIGKILNVSRKTINFHIERAKRKLGVRTRIQAIACVFSYGGVEQH